MPTPTTITPGSPSTQVEQLTVNATGGTFKIEIPPHSATSGVTHVVVTSSLAYNASAAEVETAMNAAIQTGDYLGAEVAVTGGPGGTSPYTITWGGKATNHSLVSQRIDPLRTDSKELTGGTHTATLVTVTAGLSPAQLVITATNVGGKATDGSTVTLSDVLPAGLTATEVIGSALYTPFTPVVCEAAPAVSCTYNGIAEPGATLTVTISLSASGSLPASVSNEATVTGGGALAVTTSTSLPVGFPDGAFRCRAGYARRGVVE